MSKTKKTYFAKSCISVNVTVSEFISATVRFEMKTDGSSMFVTTDKTLQDALEADYNYRKLYKLDSIKSVNYDVTEPKVSYSNREEYSTIGEETNARKKADEQIIASSFSATEYDSTSSLIKFYNKLGNVIATIPAQPFITDGMVSSVAVDGSNLVITFNTDSGKQPISIPLTLLNYPTITEEEMNEVLSPDEEDNEEQQAETIEE